MWTALMYVIKERLNILQKLIPNVYNVFMDT